MFESNKLKKRGLKNTNEFLDESRLQDYKLYYYYYDVQFNKFYWVMVNLQIYFRVILIKHI